MEASELMVADWVQFQDTILRVITPLNDNYYIDSEGTNSEGERVEYQTEYVDPVPITREILEKNGFKKQHTLMGDEFVFTDKEDNACEILFFFEDDIHVNHMRVLSNTSSVERAVRNINVHELQHALKFCEIEKQIVL